MTDTELEDWAEMNLDEFERRFEASPVKRTTVDGFKRNVRNAPQNALDRRADRSPATDPDD